MRKRVGAVRQGKRREIDSGSWKKVWGFLPSTRRTTRMPERRPARHKIPGVKSPDKDFRPIWAGSGLGVGWATESCVDFGLGSGVGLGSGSGMGFGSGPVDTGVGSFGSGCFILGPNGSVGSSFTTMKGRTLETSRRPPWSFSSPVRHSPCSWREANSSGVRQLMVGACGGRGGDGSKGGKVAM